MFANFKAKLLKVDLRKEGRKVIVLETSARMSAGELEALSEMIDQEVAIGLDSQVVSYRVRKDAKTDQPLIQYKVIEGGVVEEVKQEGAQVELDLGLPTEKQKIKEEPAEIKRGVVEEFILEGLAPRHTDLDYDFEKILRRNLEGESYLRLASELELSSGKLAEVLDEYFKRVAPLAAKWDEWREGQAQAVDQIIADATGEGNPKPDEPGQEATETDQQPGAVVQESEQTGQQSKEINDSWMLDGGLEKSREGETGTKETTPGADPVLEDIEEFILEKAPTFEDIPFDFPELLKRKKAGESWMEIAQSLNVPSTTVSTAWNKYKKKVKEKMTGSNGAA